MTTPGRSANEAIANYVPLLSEQSAAFLHDVDHPTARRIVTIVRSVVDARPAHPLTCQTEYDDDASNYLEESQRIFHLADDTPEAFRYQYERSISAEERQRLQELEQTWRASTPAYKQWERGALGQGASPISGSRTHTKQFFRGTQVIVAGAARHEARLQYLRDCEAIGRVMLARMRHIVETTSTRDARNKQIEAAAQEAHRETKQLPHESTISDFWGMNADQQREITAVIGSECLSLWQILEAHGSAHQLMGLREPRLARPVADLSRMLPRIEGKAQKVALTTAFVAEGAWFQPEKDKKGEHPPIEPPQPGAFEASLVQMNVPPEIPQGPVETVADLEVNHTYLLTEDGQRLTVPETRRIIDRLIDATADLVHEPHQSHGAQRRLSWETDKSDFAALLCGNRPIAVYDLSITPLEGNPEVIGSKLEISPEDTRLYRFDAVLKSTGRQAVANSLHVVVWGMRAKHTVQVRKKALDKKSAAAVVSRQHTDAAETAVRRKFIIS